MFTAPTRAPRLKARHSTRPAARLTALLAAALLALTACSGDAEAPSSAPAPDEETKAEPKPKFSPFTGETVAQLPKRRAVAVKIENTESGEPQSGVGRADLVVREVVEGGLTRLVAFYYSSLPKRVGPARSMRATDIGIVKPSKGVLTGSGGHPITMRRINKANVPIARESEGLSGYFRVDGRVAPYDLFMNLSQLPKSTLKGPKPPPYLPFGSEKDLGKGKSAKRAMITFSGVTSASWRWNGRFWERSDSHAAKGDDYRPTNVLALEVKQVDAGYLDPAGNPVPESVLTGKGKATLLHDGKAYEGVWQKKSLASPLQLVTEKGEKLPVPPGHTWIELVPAGSGDVEVGG